MVNENYCSITGLKKQHEYGVLRRQRVIRQKRVDVSRAVAAKVSVFFIISIYLLSGGVSVIIMLSTGRAGTTIKRQGDVFQSQTGR